MNKMSDSPWVIACDDDIYIDKNQKKICLDLSDEERYFRVEAHKAHCD